MRRVIEIVEGEVRSRPSGNDFEMAYQARLRMARIRFVIRHKEQFSATCVSLSDANLQFLNALGRLDSLDRRFQIRYRVGGALKQQYDKPRG
jgi:hypothetical protein